MYQLYPCDCISGAAKYLRDDSIDLIITDPPYGIQGDDLHKHYHRNEEYVIDGYVEVHRDEYAGFSQDWIAQAARVLRPGGSIYVFSGHTNLPEIIFALRNAGLNEQNHIIWKYNFGVYTAKKYVTSHYHLLYYTKPGGPVTFNTFARFGSGERTEGNRSLNYQDREDVWIIKREYQPGQTKNKNALPWQILIKIMQYSSNAGDTVADFFLGGFSTAKVALGLKRKIAGFEINRKSFDYNISEIEQTIPGFLLPSLKTGSNDLPVNLRKRWTDAEIQNLEHRYHTLTGQIRNKRDIIEILQNEFERGYFSILNKISEISER